MHESQGLDLSAERKSSQGLELVSSRFRKVTFGSLGCGPRAQSVLKPAPGGHEQGGSWQCRNAGKVNVWS